MFVGNGNAIMDMLMKAPGKCPKCGTSLTFSDAAQLAKSIGISDNVVMCSGCRRIFEVNLVPGKLTLTNDVTDRYPDALAKAPAAPAPKPEPKPAPAPKPEPKPEPKPAPAPKPEPEPRKRGFFARLFGK